MLGSFVEFYPEETFHSAAARASDDFDYPSAASFVRSLFGTRELKSSLVYFPMHLGAVLENIPSLFRFDVDKVIDQHSLLPFIAPFSAKELVSQIIENIQTSDTTKKSAPHLGAVRFLHDQLHSCSECVIEDKKTHDECYWHRVHQIRGVLVCPYHLVFLERSEHSAHVRGHKLISVEKAVKGRNPQRIDPMNHDHQQFLQLARDAFWLLQQSNLIDQRTTLNQRIHVELAKRGLATNGNKKRPRLFVEEFRKTFSDNFLAMLDCKVELSDSSSWLINLANASARVYSNPIPYLLMFQFLGYSAEEFFSLPASKPPFGEGPWPCLNMACTDSLNPTIDDCEIVYRKDDDTFTGTFGCKCGFTYYRVGPDKSEKDRYKFLKVISYGYVWEKRLQDLWANRTKRKVDICNELNVGEYLLNAEAKRLGLSEREEVLPNSIIKLLGLSTGSVEELKKACQALWLQVRTENPTSTRTELVGKLNWVYEWLRQNEPDWLERNSPPLLAGPKPWTDWITRDEETKELVRLAALRLRNRNQYPEFVSQTAILREANLPLWNSKTLERRLPQTKQVLEQLADNDITFRLRCIVWLKNDALRTKRKITVGQFNNRLNMHRIAKNSQITEAINEAVQEINKALS